MARGKSKHEIWQACLALILLGQAASAINPNRAITQYGHTAWRVQDGYFPGSVTAIAQTRDGYLWIGTEAGLLRFDGVRFEPWKPPQGTDLPSQRVFGLLSAGDGSLWIGTSGGLAQWKDGTLRIYAKEGRFQALLEDRDGIIWAGHTRKVALPPLCRISGSEFRCFGPADGLPLSYVEVLHEDSQGNLWVGGDGKVCLWKSLKADCLMIKSLARSVGGTPVEAIANDSDGTLWVGTGAAGILRLVAGSWQHYADSSGSSGLAAISMFLDRDGGLWIGSTSQGIIRYFHGRTERFTRADGLSGDNVGGGIFEDREGNIWVATSAGLDQFRDLRVATLTKREGLPYGTVVSVIASGDGSIWIAENRALEHLEHGRLSVLGPKDGFLGKAVTSLFEDSRGRLWVGVDSGLAWREHNRFFRLTMPDGSAVGVVISMAEDRDGSVWIGTTTPSHALIRVRNGRVVEVIPGDRFGGAQITAIQGDPNGGVWLGLDAGGITLYRSGRVLSYTTADGLAAGSVRTIFLDAHGLWAATPSGLSRLKDGRFNTLNSQNGLPCDDIEATVISNDGSLWLKTSCGLVRISLDELDSWSEHPERRIQVHLLDAFDGVQSGMSPFGPRAAKSTDGRLWFPIDEGGIQVVDPAHFSDNRLPPPLRIEKIIADRKIYDPVSSLRLPALTRDLEIDYTALSLTLPKKVGFRYKLEGLDKDWQDVGTRREAFYTNLRPRHYRFHVIACNNDGVWNEAGAASEFSILPAFYQTHWFLLLCLVATGSLIWAGYRWRVRQMAARLDLQFQERLAERTRVAQDLHDTLLQGFLSASLQLQVAETHLPDDLPAKSMVGEVLDLMGSVIEEGRNAVRGLRSWQEESCDLTQAFSRIPKELGGRQQVDYRVTVEGQPRPLHPVVRDDVYRIAREAVVNAFRHAQARGIEVELKYAPGELQILVRDDGCGIDPQVLRTGREGHWGLSGMRERAERIGAKLKVWSRPAGGTEVELSIPSGVAFRSYLPGRLGWVARLHRRKAEPSAPPQKSEREV